MSVAALPWYDFAELRSHTDAWWVGIARHLRAAGVEDVPERLDRGDYVAHWRRPDLLLSQSCGYDLLYEHAERLVPVATPCYTAAGCEGPRYRSAVLVRVDSPIERFEDLRGERVAVNQASSHSGTNAMRPLAAELQRDGAFFGEVCETGAHVESLTALRDQRVDAACVDVVVLELLEKERPAAVSGLRSVAATASAPAPPYVTARATPAARLQLLRSALLAAAADPELAAARDALGIQGFEVLPASCYDELREFEQRACAEGYRELPAPPGSPLRGAR